MTAIRCSTIRPMRIHWTSGQRWLRSSTGSWHVMRSSSVMHDPVRDGSIGGRLHETPTLSRSSSGSQERAASAPQDATAPISGTGRDVLAEALRKGGPRPGRFRFLRHERYRATSVSTSVFVNGDRTAPGIRGDVWPAHNGFDELPMEMFGYRALTLEGGPSPAWMPGRPASRR